MSPGGGWWPLEEDIMGEDIPDIGLLCPPYSYATVSDRSILPGLWVAGRGQGLVLGRCECRTSTGEMRSAG